MTIVGIDPGVSGALAILSGEQLIEIRDLPAVARQVAGKKRREIDPALLHHMLRDVADEAEHVYIELVGPMPRDGAVGGFAFGRCFGQLLQVVACHQIPYTLLRPQAWRKILGLQSKDDCRAMASRWWPGAATMWKAQCHTDRAEAALIALAGARTRGGASPSSPRSQRKS
jgi:crossover junction endodeoxyribonuclease RuvC